LHAIVADSLHIRLPRCVVLLLLQFVVLLSRLTINVNFL